jgi:RNA polymerase sigma-B factor
VELYMPLVDALARRHERRASEHDDLVQAGSIGLLNAIERFDPKRGEEFVAYAVPTISGEMRRHLRDRGDAVRLPRRLHEARSQLPRVREQLTARLGRGPSASELADAAGLSTDDLARLESAVDSPGPPEAGAAAGEPDATESRLLLADAFRSLDDTERKLLYLRYIRDRSRREVAEALGISPTGVTRRTTVALAKLRKELEGRAFKQAAGGPAREPADAGAEDPPAVVAEAEPSDAKPAAEAATAPDAKARTSHSGRLMLRMPQSLHAELAQAAEREDVSLNQYITNALSAAVAWHSSEERQQSAPGWLPAAIVANIVVVVIAGIVALVLLVVAWQQGW